MQRFALVEVVLPWTSLLQAGDQLSAVYYPEYDPGGLCFRILESGEWVSRRFVREVPKEIVADGSSGNPPGGSLPPS